MVPSTYFLDAQIGNIRNCECKKSNQVTSILLMLPVDILNLITRSIIGKPRLSLVRVKKNSSSGFKDRVRPAFLPLGSIFSMFDVLPLSLFFCMHFFSGTKHPREDNPNLYCWAEITGLHTQTFNIITDTKAINDHWPRDQL